MAKILLRRIASFVCFTLWSLAFTAAADDEIELRTTTIKGNTELPKILYVVPWQDVTESDSGQQKLVLHSLFGDLFEPHTPPKPQHIKTQNK